MTVLDSPAAVSAQEPPAAAAGRPAVEVAHLRKTYGTLVAVDDVSFTVAVGEIFGILGPNGAGKTTAIECAIGLRRPDAGTIRLLGLDPHADPDQVHEIVGVQLQSGALPAKLRVGEILEEYRPRTA
jgi:ABC-2 type transport system ATP-binding protein